MSLHVTPEYNHIVLRATPSFTFSLHPPSPVPRISEWFAPWDPRLRQHDSLSYSAHASAV